MEQMYSLTQVAKIFSVTRQTILNWVKTGTIHAVKVGRKWLVKESEIERVQNGSER